MELIVGTCCPMVSVSQAMRRTFHYTVLLFGNMVLSYCAAPADFFWVEVAPVPHPPSAPVLLDFVSPHKCRQEARHTYISPVPLSRGLGLPSANWGVYAGINACFPYTFRSTRACIVLCYREGKCIPQKNENASSFFCTTQTMLRVLCFRMSFAMSSSAVHHCLLTRYLVYCTDRLCSTVRVLIFSTTVSLISSGSLKGSQGQ